MFREKDEPEFQWLEEGILNLVAWACKAASAILAGVYNAACLIIGISPNDPE
jgi:hypothetical protein